MSTVNFNDTTPAPPAQNGNVKFQSDASGNISAYAPFTGWTSWTPSISATAGMTITSPTINQANYCIIAKTVHFVINFAVTLGGTAGTVVAFTLPPGLNPVAGTFLATVDVFYNFNGFHNPAVCQVSGTSGQLILAQTAVWPLGTVTPIATGFYQIP